MSIIKVIQCNLCKRKEELGEETKTWYLLKMVKREYFILVSMSCSTKINVNTAQEAPSLHICNACMVKTYPQVLDTITL